MATTNPVDARATPRVVAMSRRDGRRRRPRAREDVVTTLLRRREARARATRAGDDDDAGENDAFVDAAETWATDDGRGRREATTTRTSRSSSSASSSSSSASSYASARAREDEDEDAKAWTSTRDARELGWGPRPSNEARERAARAKALAKRLLEGDEDEPTARGEIVGGEVARDVGSERLRSVLTIDSATSGGDSDPERLAKRRARRRAAKRRHERRLREGVFT